MMRRIAPATLGPSIIALAAFMAIPATAQVDVASTEEANGVAAKITGTSFITHDAEASAAFYVKYLGFKILRDAETDSEATRAVYGLLGQEQVRIILVVPKIWSREDPEHLGIAFAQAQGEMDRPYPLNTQRLPRLGETTIGFEVTGLDDIIAMMEADSVPVVVPLAPSATGRSRAITVLDPNGMRIQLYEYLAD